MRGSAAAPAREGNSLFGSSASRKPSLRCVAVSRLLPFRLAIPPAWLMLMWVAFLLKITTLEYVTPSAVRLGSLMSVSAALALTTASTRAQHHAGAFHRQYLRAPLTTEISAGLACWFSAKLCV